MNTGIQQLFTRLLISSALLGYYITALPVVQAASPLRHTVLPPGGLKLLPGYTYKPKMGIDTLVGEITKPSGMTLRLDIGALSGDQAEWQNKLGRCLWYKDQQVNGQRVEIALDKDSNLTVTVGGFANFYGKATTSEDMVDALMMVFTYSLPRQTKASHRKPLVNTRR